MIETFLFSIPRLEEGMPVMDSIAQKVLHCLRTGMSNFPVSFELYPLQKRKKKQNETGCLLMLQMGCLGSRIAL